MSRKSFSAAALCLPLFLFVSMARAIPYRPGLFELAPSTPIQCAWRTMAHEIYKRCLERREFFRRMTESEKKAFNKAVRRRQKAYRARKKRGRRKKVAGGLG